MKAIMRLFWIGFACAQVAIVHSSPLYSRTYHVSCTACHSAAPALNDLGQRFAVTGVVPFNKKSDDVNTKDDKLELTKAFPFSVRASAFMQLRRGSEILDFATGEAGVSNYFDMHAPDQIKLISGSAVSDQLDFLFVGTFAPAINEGAIVLNEGWVRYRSRGLLPMNVKFGQFLVTDVMFNSKTRLTFQPYLAYQLSRLGIDRGIRVDGYFDDLPVSVGVTNVSDAIPGAPANAAGINRDNYFFDNNTRKNFYAYFRMKFSLFDTGFFWLNGRQQSVSGVLADQPGDAESTRLIFGLDFAMKANNSVRFYGQGLMNQWVDFIVPGDRYIWYAGFIGADYFASDELTFSLLYNYATAGEFDGSGTIYEGLDLNAITTSASFYMARNARLILEITLDLLPIDNDVDFVGHEDKEDYLSLGFDLSF